jgi:hypothetical protein
MKNLNKNITRKNQNNNFIVYIHIRPDIHEPFYVGKGVPGREIRTCGRNQHWKNIVNKNNSIFESKILFKGLNEGEALLKEREIELDLKNKGYILTNIIECGIKAGTTGMKHSEESKRKISEGLKGHISPNKGKKQSKETCDKKSKSMLGKKVRLGIKDSEETRKKKSEAFKKRNIDWESRNKKASEKLKGQKRSEETKEKISKSHIGKSKSKEHCNSISKGKLGKSLGPKSEEHKKKLSDSLKKREYKQEWKDKLSEVKKGKGVKPILQFDKQGNFIKEWSSIKEALENVGGDIHGCLNGRIKYSSKSIWKYKNN